MLGYQCRSLGDKLFTPIRQCHCQLGVGGRGEEPQPSHFLLHHIPHKQQLQNWTADIIQLSTQYIDAARRRYFLCTSFVPEEER
jgi:hypothetical protein